MAYPLSPGQPLVPYFELLRLVDASSSEGRSACAMEVGDWLEGTGELGMQAAVTGFADCVLSYAATAPHPGDLNVTLGLQVDFWRAPPPVGTLLTGTAQVQIQQGSVALVHGRILTGGDVLATGTLRAMATPPGAGAPAAASPGTAAPAPSEPPTRREPPAAGPAGRRGPLPAAVAAGAGDLGRVLSLELARRCGAELAAVATAGAVRLRLATPPELERTFGVVHGGAVAALGQLAGAAAMQAVLPAGVRPRRLSVTIDYLRPMVLGAPVDAVATVVHRSRRVIVTDVDLLDADGRRTARLTERAVIEAG